MKQNQTQERERFPMWRYLFVMLLALFTGTGGAWAQYVWNGGTTFDATSWAVASNWTTTTPGTGGPGVSGSNSWGEIQISNVTSGTTPTLEGWNLKMVLDASTVTVSALNKLQTGNGGSTYFTLKNSSNLTVNGPSSGNRSSFTVDLSTGANTMTFVLLAAYPNTVTVNYGTVSSSTSRLFNLQSSTSGTTYTLTGLTINATLDEINATETTTLHSVKIGNITDITVTPTLNNTQGYTVTTGVLAESDANIGKCSVVQDSSTGDLTLYWVTGTPDLDALISTVETELAKIGTPVIDERTALETALASAKAGTSDWATLNSAYAAYKTAAASSTVSTLYLPTGYYYMKNMDTSRNPYLYNNYLKTTSYNGITLQSASAVTTNNGIWKITNNGTTVNIVNGEGTNIVQGNQNQSDFTSSSNVTSHSSLTFGAYSNTNYTNLGGIYFTEGMNASNGGYTVTIDGTSTRCLTTWAGQAGAKDDRWTFEAADIDDIYTVAFAGTIPTGAYIKNSNNEVALSGGFYSYASAPATTDFTAGASGSSSYPVTISISGKTITATFPTLYALSGTVVNASSTGIAGATVTATGKTDGYVFTATTDDNGAYSMNVSPDEYTISVSATDYKTNTATATVSTEAVTADNITLTSSVLDVPVNTTYSLSSGADYTRITVEGTLVVDADYDLSKVTGTGNVTIAKDFSLTGSTATAATGKLTINADKTLSIGVGTTQATASIASFTSVELNGMIYRNNSTVTIQNLTVPAGSTGTILSHDQSPAATADTKGTTLSGTTTVNGTLRLENGWKSSYSIATLAGSGSITITGNSSQNSGNYASYTGGTSSSNNEAANYTITDASTYTGSVTINNDDATVTVSGDLAASTWTNTNGTLNYSGTTVPAGATLTNVKLTGSDAVSVGGTVVATSTTPTSFTLTALTASLRVPTGTYTVTSGVADHEYTTLVDATAGTTTYSFANVTGTITGNAGSYIINNVSTANSTNLSGATVTLTNTTDNTLTYSTTTISDGKYAIYVPDGTYTMTVSATGYTNGTVESVTASSTAATQDLALTATKYDLYSGGMPSGSTVTINGVAFSALNNQSGNSIYATSLTTSDVKVSVGGGYGYVKSVDTANKQINVDFYQIFTPATAIDAEDATQYLLMDGTGAYVYVDDSGNIFGTTTKKSADKFVIVEDASNTGDYYFYDVTQSKYIVYTATSASSNVQVTSSSVVQLATDKPTEKGTWKVRLESSALSFDVFPAADTDPEANTSTQAWNFRGGTGYVLNLYNSNDNNATWTIVDPSAGSLACATKLYSTPGAEFIHKLVPNSGETISGVTFGDDLKDLLALKTDRASVGNQYKYVYGTAPETAGTYTYTVQATDADNNVTNTTVTLIVSSSLQAPTPMMGWLSWNWFESNITETKMIAIANGMKSKGLIDAGYTTLVLDDAWAAYTTDKSALNWDATKFPDGANFASELKAIDSKMRLGLYSDAGSMTCGGYQPGSYGYEEAHMTKYKAWGASMLKYDFCNNQAGAYASYKAMGDAITKVYGTDPFIFNICEWGNNSPWTWGAEAGGSSWRVTQDGREEWIGNHSRVGVLAAVDEARNLWMYAGVNRFNDLDMLCIGLHGLGGPSNNTSTHQSNGGTITGLTDAQARTQMSLWCMLSSPLAVTCDLRETPAADGNSSAGTLPDPLITTADLATLTNKDIIAINQDALGQQAEYMPELCSTANDDLYATSGYNVFVKDLAGGKIAVSVTNRGSSEVTVPAIDLTKVYLDGDETYACHEVWSNTYSQVTGTLPSVTLAAYETKVYVLGGANVYNVTFTKTNNLGYVATFCAPENVSTGTDVQAYTATVSDNTVTLNEISDGVIAKDAGVILVNNSTTSPTSASLIATSTEATVTQTYGASTNLLKGVTEETELSDATNCYGLVKSNDYAIFRALEATTIPAYKAYLQLPASDARTFNIVFGEATGIDAVQNGSSSSKVQGSIYDLTGRKQNNLQRGVNIVNGKKVIR